MIVPKNSKDIQGLRTFLTTIRTQSCSAAEGFGGALKEMAGELVKKIDGFIGELPKDDVAGDWNLESKLDSLCALMAQASAIASLSGLELSKLRADNAEQLAGAVSAEVRKQIDAGTLIAKDGLDAAVAAAVKAQTESGALVPKETVTQLCADAKSLGVKEVNDTMAAAEQKRQLIATRKTALQTAGLPLPDATMESVLGGTEQEFETLKTTFATRLDALKKQGYQLAGSPLLSKLFAPEAEYAQFTGIISGIEALKTPPPEVIGGQSAVPAKGGKPMVV